MGVVAYERDKVAPGVVIPHEKDLAVAEVAQRPGWRPPGAVVGDLKGSRAPGHGVPVDEAPAPDHPVALLHVAHSGTYGDSLQ